MSITVNVPQDKSFLVGCIPQLTAASTGNWLLSDPFLYTLHTAGVTWIVGPVAVSQIVGRGDTTAYDPWTLVGLPPNDSPYSETSDDAIYQNYLTNIGFFGKLLSGVDVNTFRAGREHNTRHCNVSGSVDLVHPAGFFTEPLKSEGYTPYMNCTLPKFTSSVSPRLWSQCTASAGLRYSNIYTDASANPYVTYGGTSTSGARARVGLLWFLDWFFNMTGPGHSDASYYWVDGFAHARLHYSDFIFEDSTSEGSSDRVLTFGYTLTTDEWLGVVEEDVNHSVYKFVYTLTWIPKARVGALEASKTYALGSNSGHFRFHMEVSCIVDSGRRWTGAQFTQGTSFTGDLPYWTTALSTRANLSGVITDDVQNALNERLTMLDRRIWYDIRNLAVVSFISTSDAMSNLTESINQNMIENLVEIRDILDAIPNFSTLVRSVVELKQGNILRSIRDVLDFITELRLQDRFAIAPTLDLVENGLTSAASAMGRLEQLRRALRISGRGVFRWDFPNGTFGLDTASLEARSKVTVAGGGITPAVANVLGLQALGFLPSPSNAWDLIPWSFVVDWFASIGSRLDQLESMAILSLIGVESFVHSYRITSPVTTEELAQVFGSALMPSVGPGSTLKWVWYGRFVSRHMPPAWTSTFDFNLPSGPPSWFTAASLAWQSLLG